MAERLGFVGLGDMGRPMASRLARAGMRPLLWARRAESAADILPLGAELAPDIATLCAGADTICVMLADSAALDSVFARGTEHFAALLSGKTLVQMGTTAPGYSAALGAEITGIGGTYVELPVSGSTGPAAEGQLVAMAAGDPGDIARITPLVAPMVASVIPCGAVPKALAMKLAVNAYLVGLVGGLIEAVDFAEASDLDLATLQHILEAGPMDNAVTRSKLPKLMATDYAPQGSVRQALNNTRMITEAGAALGAPMAVNMAVRKLYEMAQAEGMEALDMVAIRDILRAQRKG